MARASPDCAMIASRLAWALVSLASVATTTSVVLARALPFVRTSSAFAGSGSGHPRPPDSPFCSNGAAQNHGPEPTRTLPAALTAASAPTIGPSELCADAEPRPPLQLTVVAPAPAPTLPSAKTAAARVAAA